LSFIALHLATQISHNEQLYEAHSLVGEWRCFGLPLFTIDTVFRLEKYRPQVFEDIVGNEEAIERFKHFSVHGNIPNFILAGPPGVGKTTVRIVLN